jgi:hypothetical protein
LANYSTPAQLGYVDEEALRIEHERAARKTEGIAGAWTPVMKPRPPPQPSASPSIAKASLTPPPALVASSSSHSTPPPPQPVQQQQQAKPDDDDDDEHKTNSRRLRERTAPLDDVPYDFGEIKLKTKPSSSSSSRRLKSEDTTTLKREGSDGDGGPLKGFRPVRLNETKRDPESEAAAVKKEEEPTAEWTDDAAIPLIRVREQDQALPTPEGGEGEEKPIVFKKRKGAAAAAKNARRKIDY